MNTLVALCAVGAEKILGNEIKHLGYTLSGNAAGRVFFLGDDDALFRANLCLRTADRVYLQMAVFSASNFDELFDGVYTVDWQNYFKKDTRVVVDKVRAYRSKLNSERTVQSMVHKAVYTKLGDKWRMTTLPESGEVANIRVYIENDTAHILLDLSGEPLHKRGYRADGGTAPLRETVAAIMLQEMVWRRKTPLHDPFCGSGTIPIEAALYAYNAAPGFGRTFALENLTIFNKRRADELRKKEAELIRTDVEVRITGSDIDAQAVERARKNAEYACVAIGRALQSIGKDSRIPRPDFVQADFAELSAPYESGLILCNPPYGERLGDEAEAQKLYKKMSVLYDNFPHWQFGIISASKNFQNCFGHYATQLKSFKAGNLNTYFYLYAASPRNAASDSASARAANDTLAFTATASDKSVPADFGV
ncbi:MAG: class I SAM-dependent RNA methyltransferase [Treponema sp.]|nr:class I SAM-dependent RNA methyltransferase [Treponema sp.]